MKWIIEQGSEKINSIDGLALVGTVLRNLEIEKRVNSIRGATCKTLLQVKNLEFRSALADSRLCGELVAGIIKYRKMLT